MGAGSVLFVLLTYSYDTYSSRMKHKQPEMNKSKQ